MNMNKPRTPTKLVANDTALVEPPTPQVTHNRVGLATHMSAMVRRDTWQDRAYWVVPVVLIAEGVHNGMYYPAEELAKYPEAWNGRPLPVWHPEDYDGGPISANDPKLWEAQSVGHLFNTTYDAETKKLKGEAWIEVAKAKEVSPELVKMLEANKRIEVSTGLFVDRVHAVGEWNGEEYKVVATNFRPDHLALLPGGEGACNWGDGAGMPRVNQRQAAKGKQPMSIRNALARALSTLRKDKQDNPPEGNEVSDGDLRRALDSAINSDLPENMIRNVVDVFSGSGYFVYEQFDGTALGMFKQGFGLDANEMPVLNGDPVEVRQQTEYVPITNEGETTQGNGAHQHNTDEGDTPMTLKERVDALIASNENEWGNDDRELLLTFNEEQLQRLEGAPPAGSDGAEGNEEEGQPAQQAAQPVTQQAAPVFNTVDELCAALPPDAAGVIKEGIGMRNARREQAIAKIMANSRNVFTKEQLKAKPTEELEGMLALSNQPIDFSLASGASPENNQEEAEEGLGLPSREKAS